MKKFAKMSLVAAVAVAGLSTTSSAKALEEAIKDVDVSGTMVYRYNDYDSGTHQNQYQVATNLSAKVNDDVKANTRFRMGNVSLDTNSKADTTVDVKLSEVNFTYTGVQGLALTVGKQAIATPWTVARDANGNESTGTGAVAAYNVGPVTLVGAYFNQTNLGETLDGELGSDFSDAEKNSIGSKDIYVVGAMASFAGVTLDAFYTDLADQFDAYTVGLEASYNVGDVKLSPFARFSSLDLENGNVIIPAITPANVPDGVVATEDQKLWQVGLGANMGIFNAFVAYGESGKDGGLVYLDSGSKVNMDYHWRITADGSADTEYLYVHADADVTSTLNVGLFYSSADYKNKNDKNEVYLQAKYKMSQNLLTYVRLGQLDEDSEDKVDMGRLHVQYSF